MKRAMLAFAILPFAASAAQYGRNYQQIMSLQATANAVNAANGVERTGDNLPIPVFNAKLKEDIISGNAETSFADLERCSSIFRNGSFAWGVPDAGTIGTKDMCVAEIQMRVVGAPGASPNVQSDKIVAVAHVGSGRSIKCSVNDFPESGYLPVIETVTFPADNEPTMKNVEEVMNSEHKQNAEWKTAAAALVGGAAGFMLSSGSDKGLGEKVGSVAVGAVAAGGLTFASTQTGKVSGDTILSVGTNAAAGAVIGNMGAGISGDGDAVLVVKDCKDEDTLGKKCLWGYVTVAGEQGLINECFFNFKKNDLKCPAKADELPAGTTGILYKNKYNYSNIILDNGSADGLKQEYINAELWQKLFDGKQECFNPSSNGGFFEKVTDKTQCKNDEFWIKVRSGNIGGKTKLAMIEDFEGDKFFGAKKKDYDEFMKSNEPYIKSGKISVVGRNPDGTRNAEETTAKADFDINNFTPLMMDAGDGDVIDFDNKARVTGTAIGAGAGAALGGLASYQGAKSEIEERWIREVERYNGSLKDVYCVTGGRYLGHYNETLIIPAMK